LVDFDKLITLNPKEFEEERQRIISKYLDSLPSEVRTKCLALQYQLDIKRDELNILENLEYSFSCISENLENMLDQFSAIKNLVAAPNLRLVK
jgi:hypothetical protein